MEVSDAPLGAVVSPALLSDITDLAGLVAWSQISAEAWNAVNSRLGNVPTIQVLAYVPPSHMAETIAAARVPLQPPDDMEIGEPFRDLTIVEATQVGLLYQAAQQKFNRPIVDPLADQFGPPSLPLTSVMPGTALAGTGSVFPPPTPGEGKRKVKCNQVLDQTDEAEVPELAQTEVDKYFSKLREVKGGPVRPESEPSSDQISAMKVRVLELGLSPYADFGIFVNFQHRFSKTLKFLNHILQPDGTFKAVEVPGPPHYDQWLSSWKVFENTLLMFEVADGEVKRPVTPSALEEYKDAFRDLVVNYPESWHLLVTAEDRCRAEHFPRMRREWEEKRRRGQAPEFIPAQPWDHIFRMAARDRDYWDKHVREPALLFRTAGGKKKEQPGGTGAGTDHSGGDVNTPKKRKNRGQKERLKAQLAKAREEKERAWESPPDKNSLKQKGPKRDQKGRFLTDRQGKQICFGFNNGECKGVCPRNMTHVCQLCLGNHPAKQCRKGPNN